MERKCQNVLITGGGGYCGNVVTPLLLSRGYKVHIYDTFYFGKESLPLNNPNLKITQGDIRDIEKFKTALKDQDAILHLACISNDASFELDEGLSTSINFESFEPMVKSARDAGISRFIYASSSSVYGVSDSPDVTEDHPLVPLTLYNKFKGLCEPILNEYASSDFTVSTFRPATVCGYSPRLRLDLSVNILTNLAIAKNKITVFGGSQLRPNLNIKDYAEVCDLLLRSPINLINKEIFNVGYQNMSIMELAKLVREVVLKEYPQKNNIEIEVTPSNDLRSYHINSDKIKRILGFSPRNTIEEAIKTICEAFKNDLVPESITDDKYYNIKTIKKLGLK